ncbi:dTDP-4-dehydrorhamnose 3,5-epimerase family protein [Amycolatopsis albispora]|uniref:dTDP-4-dehydrorhamnose 3,5-epimerase n=1 Tax=Amycolatopsis albispora TaxID=1804986 RepID=A0A344LL07_9PSEU|nr:dTDP-4-dehydrorhamnose 3,5-epimerase family protein [Amycolatopsis albispora]AXB48731.1 dTDP-4-dehydrorhamnose 3,5-epimerase [Amycolatopsis albispora]
MQVRELAVRDCFEFTPRKFPDHRGAFAAPFQEEPFRETVGHPLGLAQTNYSESRRGTIRGIHFADTPPGQAKYIWCPRGSLLDVMVDLRVGSPTFGHWDAVHLDAETVRAVYLPEGIGHSFVALEDDTVMIYLCSTSFNPSAEHGANPMDPALGLPWPADIEPILSEKDRDAPTMAQLAAEGRLPTYEACLARYEELRGAVPSR